MKTWGNSKQIIKIMEVAKMGKDKVVIAVVATIVFSGILFGILMAYRT